ncbi:MAG TPA: alpha/beta hydrolase [Gemmataceae bacterium]|nr:alpha/beta hydrolase [Gemmataceae bacterium]
MRPAMTAILLTAFAATAVFADEPTVIKLWPGKAPGETGNVGPEEAKTGKGEKAPITSITNVSVPTISVYRPAKANDAATAVIVAPGGGYNVLAWEHEGTQVAEWLNKIGVTAVVLKYRVPRRPDQPKGQPPIGALQDAQRAVSLVRSNAKEWRVNPEHIGFLGFSAGGHLTAWVSTNFDKRSYEPIDAADKESARPDFAVLVYPGGVLVKGHPDQLTPELRVSKLTPPSLLIHAADDHPESSITYFQELRKNGVQAEMHIYGAGGHGFGMHKTGNPSATWTDRCADWMKKQGYLQ